MMKFAYASAFLLLLMAVSAAGSTFSVSINGIDGARGRMVSDNKELDIGNCDMPQDIQDTVMTFRMNYPNTCNGQMDVYYSYYDFSTGAYTAEKTACSVSTTENCKITLNILFGGKGDGTETLDKWATFRAVCRKSLAEQTYDLPLSIVHTETLFEKTLMPKVTGADQSVAAAKQSLSACTCCAEKGYLATVQGYDMQLSVLKTKVSKCDFANIENGFIDLKKSMDLTKTQIDSVKCETIPPAGGTDGTGTNGTDTGTGTQTGTEAGTGTGTGTGTQTGTGTGTQTGTDGGTQVPSPCPVGAIALVVLGGLALAKGAKL
jgi:hypothetical protein